jgi:hypothetical protein
MLVYDDTSAVVASRAYELAQTGDFEDFAAIERELFAEGFGEEIDAIKRPAVVDALQTICVTSRSKAGRLERIWT